jgi:hypothetical protein
VLVKQTILFFAALFALLTTGCGGSSSVDDFDHLQKTGVVGGPSNDVHWEVLVQQTTSQLLLTYRNTGDEDLQWIRFQATHNDQSHFLYLNQDLDLSNGSLLAGEQHRITIDTPENLQFPLYFWSTFVTIHEVTIVYCVSYNEQGSQQDCDDDAPPPPSGIVSNSYFES